MNALVLDAVVAVIFLLFIILGFRSGVMRSFIMFVGAIFSSVFSGYLSGKVSVFLFENIVSPFLEKQVANSLAAGNFDFQHFCSELPMFISGSLPGYGITPSSLDSIIKCNPVVDIPVKVSKLVEPVFTGVFKSVFSVLIFLILILSVKLFARFVLKLCKHRSVHQVNSLIGGFFGALKAYVIIAVAMCCIRSLLPLMSNPPEVFSSENISSSMVFKELYFNNPVYDMFQKM